MKKSFSQEEAKTKTILETIEDGYYELDLAGNFTFFNDALCRMHGRSKKELMGLNYRNYLDEENIKILFQMYNKVYKTGIPIKEFGLQFKRKDGTKIYIEISISLKKDSSGKPVGFRGIVRDVNERKLTEEALIASEEKYRTLINSIQDAIFIIKDGKIRYANEKFAKIVDYSLEELIGKGIEDLVAPEDLAMVSDRYIRRMKGETVPREYEFRLVKKDGVTRVDVRMNVAVISYEGERVAFGTGKDITESKQSEEKYRLLAEHMKDTVWVTDLNLKLTYISPSAEKLIGYKLDEIVQLPLNKILTSSSFKTAMDFFSVEMPKALAAPPDYVLNRSLELEFVNKNGQRIWGECMFSFIRDDKGNPLSILGEAREITKRKQIEDELKASESNFRHSLDDSPLGVRISTVQGETVYANRAILDIYGYDSIEEMKNMSVKERYTPESYAEWQTRKEKRLQGEFGPSEYEISVVRKNGEVRHLQVFRKEIFWNSQKQSLVIYQDITLHRMADEKIHQSEEKYRTILENIEDGYYEVDLAGNFTFFNDSMCRIIGYGREEMMGINNRQYTDKENSKKLLQSFNEVYKTGKAARGFDWQITRKDGAKRYIEASVSLLKDSSGNRKGFRGIVSDITERKIAVEKLQQTLESLKRAVGITIQVLVSVLEAKDPYTSGHQSRSADLACAIATELGLEQDKIEGIRMAGIIHDIGKLAIPAEILTKPTKLTNLEFLLIKEHPHSGYEMLKDVESPWQLAEIIHQHHERMNGTGYPRSLKGDEILMEARILAVADVVEAMASHRPYRASLGIDPALEEIEKNKGILYDETVADACLRLFREKGYQLKEK